MAVYNGQATITLANINANNQEELTKALAWLMPVLAQQIHTAVSAAPKPKTDVSVSASSGPSGASGSVSVSGNVAGGTVTGTVSGGGGGVSGSVTGT